jgi:hypothetical protein
MAVITRTVPYYHTLGFILGRKAEKGIIGLHISETRQTCCYQYLGLSINGFVYTSSRFDFDIHAGVLIGKGIVCRLQ